MIITRIELLSNGAVFELGVVSKYLRNAKGKSQKVKEIHLVPSEGVPTISIIGEDRTSVHVFGSPCFYTTISGE